MVADEYDIPRSHFEFAKLVAEVPAEDPEAVLCYRLTGQQAHDIAGAIDAAIDADAFNFYLEGFAATISG
jgi:hypothetical protein